MNRFLVWNPKAGFPTVSHHSHDAAVKESERLAALHPGEEFHVMAPIGYSIVEKPSLFRENPDYRYIPF